MPSRATSALHVEYLFDGTVNDFMKFIDLLVFTELTDTVVASRAGRSRR